MISNIQDKTVEFNANNGFKADVSLWETISVQFVNPSGTISITGTNDANGVTGVSDGSALTSANYTAVQATKLADGTAVTSVAAAGLYKIPVTFKYIQFGGASAAADKVILFETKPY